MYVSLRKEEAFKQQLTALKVFLSFVQVIEKTLTPHLIYNNIHGIVCLLCTAKQYIFTSDKQYLKEQIISCKNIFIFTFSFL